MLSDTVKGSPGCLLDDRMNGELFCWQTDGDFIWEPMFLEVIIMLRYVVSTKQSIIPGKGGGGGAHNWPDNPLQTLPFS